MTSERTRVRRRPDRGRYDRETVYGILDEALTCTVAFVRDGRPVAIPTIHARRGDVLYLHGSPASGFIREASDRIPVCELCPRAKYQGNSDERYGE